MKARLSEGNKPEWDLDLKYGKHGEALVAEFLRGMLESDGRLTVEVKADRQFHRTGNIWIEVMCRRADGWHDSGIRTSTADMWTIVLGETVFFGVPTEMLRAIAEHAYIEADSYGTLMFRSEEKDGSHPTRGVKLPLNLFLMRLRTELVRAQAAA